LLIGSIYPVTGKRGYTLLGIDPVYLQAAAVLLGLFVLWIVFRSRRMHVFELLLVVTVVLAAGYYFTYDQPLLGMMRQGLDLQGGTRLVMQAVPTDEAPVTEERLEAAVGVIRQRVDRLGVAEPVIYQIPGKDRIVVELAAVTREEALEIVKIAFLSFKDAEGNVIITGNDLIKAQEQLDPSGTAYIHLELTPDAKRRFAAATTRVYSGQSASRQIFIYLDDDQVQAPTVQAPNIEDPIIQGYPSLKDARRVATILNIGALPVQLNVSEVREVSASLGHESLARSQTAALIGIAGVALFMLLFYRGAGFIANFALIIYALLVIGALYMIDAVLSLPGVAGLVLGVGIAVDANVIIYERIKDHLRLGRTLRAAVESGFRSAMRTVIDSNVTTLIASAVLFYYGTGPVRGFATTLGVSILASMVTAVVFSQYVLRLVVGSRLVRKASILFGEKEANLSGAR
jgi:preprotein translocase subunit SecD